MTEEVNKHLLRAIRRILRPIARILLRNGVTANVFQEMSRKVFVDVAFEEFSISGKPQTLARVSVITGLNRKEVARLHNQDSIVETDPTQWNRAGTVLAGWMSDQQFRSNAGFPVDLSFAEGTPNFSQLVKKYSGDMYPRSVADELLRLGAIEEVEGRFRLAHRGYSPGADPAAMMDILGLDASEFIETIDHNIQSATNEKLLQVKVLANNLPASQLGAFNDYSKRVSLRAMDEIVEWLNDHDAGRDFSGKDGRFSVGIGMFQINRSVRAENASDEGAES